MVQFEMTETHQFSLNVSVLVVDDEQFARQILVRTVKREGYSVSEAVDGIEALEKMEDGHFDFVISDIRMPRMNGLQLLKEIKTSYPETSVLLITGNKAEISSEAALAAGADHFITKPFKNLEIAQTLKALFIRRLQQQRRKLKSRR